jgi:hypothetical protein
LCQQIGQITPFDQFHRDERAAVVLTLVEDGDDIGVTETGGGAGGEVEVRGECCIAPVAVAEQFNRDGVIEDAVTRAIDARTLTPTELFQQIILFEELEWGDDRSFRGDTTHHASSRTGGPVRRSVGTAATRRRLSTHGEDTASDIITCTYTLDQGVYEDFYDILHGVSLIAVRSEYGMAGQNPPGASGLWAAHAATKPPWGG